MSHYYSESYLTTAAGKPDGASRVLGHYPLMDDAITRVRVEAALHQPSEVIVHLRGGDTLTDSTFGWTNPGTSRDTAAKATFVSLATSRDRASITGDVLVKWHAGGP